MNTLSRLLPTHPVQRQISLGCYHSTMIITATSDAHYLWTTCWAVLWQILVWSHLRQSGIWYLLFRILWLQEIETDSNFLLDYHVPHRINRLDFSNSGKFWFCLFSSFFSLDKWSHKKFALVSSLAECLIVSLMVRRQKRSSSPIRTLSTSALTFFLSILCSIGNMK